LGVAADVFSAVAGVTWVNRVPPGMNAVDAADASDWSVDSFVAFTVNVYGVPSVRPDTVQPALVTAVQVKSPGDEVTV
jgi:hypothetical protein